MKKRNVVLFLLISILFSIGVIAANVWITPNPAGHNQDLTCNVASGTGYTYKWFKNGAETGINSNFLSNSQTTIGDSWKCEVWKYYGSRIGWIKFGEDTASIINNAPTLIAPSISVGTYYTNSMLTCNSGSYSDADGDSVSVNWRWYRNGNQINGQTSQTLDLSINGNGNKNDNINCAEQAVDSYGTTSSWMNSNTITILNSLPVVSNAAVAPTSGYENTVFTCSYSFSDADNDLNNSRIQWYNQVGQISGANSSTINGTYFNKNDMIYCRVTADDETADGNTIQSNSVAISNSAPVLNLIGDQTVNEGELLQFTISATDLDNDPLVYSTNNLPSGAIFDAGTQTFTWTPDSTQAGVYPNVRFEVTDGTDIDFEDITITVNNVNNPPTLVSNIPDQAWDEDNILNLDLSPYFSDIDGDTLSYSVILAPTDINAVINGNISTLTPNADWNGINTIQFRADDGNGGTVDSNVVTLTVNSVNDDPAIISTPLTTAAEGSLYTYDVDAIDVDNDTLTYSLLVSPFGMSIDSGTGLITWTPDYGQAGLHDVTIGVNDGNGGIAQQVFQIDVANTNVAPVINSFNPTSNVTMDEDTTQPFDVTASDFDNDTLTYSWYLDNNPIGTGLPNYDYYADFDSAGLHNVTVIVSDGSLEASVSWDVTVNNVNRAPILIALITPDPATFDEDTTNLSAFDLDNFFSDPDLDTLTYSFSGNTNVNAIINPDNTVDFSAAGNWSGTETIIFRATDTGGLFVEDSIDVIVAPVNDAPWIFPVIPNQIQDEDVAPWTLDLSSYENDVEDTDLNLNWAVSDVNTSLFTTSFDANNNIITFTPVADAFGSDDINLTLTDSGGLTASQIITVTLNPINDAPVFNGPISDVIFDEDTSLLNYFNLNSYFSDVDGDALSYFVNGNTSVIITIDADGNVSFSALPDWNGQEQVIFTATDSSSATANSNLVTITVNPINDAPVITSTPITIATEGVLYSYDVDATDVDLDNLTYSLVTAPSVMTIDPSTGLIQWTPAYNQVGLNNVNVSVDDGNGWLVSQAFTIDVANVPPILTSYIFELQGLGNTTANNVYISPANLDNYLDGLRIFASSNEIVDWVIRIQNANDPWATRNDATSISRPSSCAYWNGTFNQCSGTALADGVYNVNITITDFGGASVSDTSKTITIDNTAPTITINNIQDGAYYNTTITPDITISDLNGVVSNSTYLDSAPYTGNPITDGLHTLEVNATDIAGNLATTLISFTVDTIAPVVTIDPVITPTNVSVQTITGTFTDANIANITVNGVLANLGAGTYDATISLVEGNNVIDVIATDLANNIGTASTNILLDTIAPLTTDDAPSTWQNADFVVNLTATDSGSGVSYTTYNLDGSGWVTGTSISITTTGNHTIQYYSVDNAGNVENVKTAYALLDKDAPIVTNLTINPSLLFTGQSTEISANAIDNVDVASVTAEITLPDASIDAVILTETSQDFYSITYSNTALNGTYNVRIIATDVNGNVNNAVTSPFNVALTNTAPTLNQIGDKSVNENQTLTFTISATDAENDTLTYSASGLPSGAIFDAGTQTFTWTPDFTQAGSYQVNFSVSDGQLMDSELITITVYDVDITAPIVTILEPVNGSTKTSNNVLVSFNVDEPATTTYSLDGGAQQAITNGTTLSIADGNHTLTIFATDPSNNVGSASVSFTVDTRGILAGYILNATDNSTLDGATIQLIRDGIVKGETTSLVDGSYSITIVAGPYNVTVFRTGFYDATINNINLVTATTTDLNVTLTPVITTGILTGTITDANNTIYNANVQITKDGVTVAALQTDANGDYSVDLNIGIYNITVSKPGFNNVYAYNFNVNAGVNAYDVVLTQNNAIAGGISGTIYDLLNLPATIADATINIYKSSNLELVQIVKSNSAGQYVVNGLPTIETYDLEAVAAGYTNQTFATGIGITAGGMQTYVDAFMS
ncbi:MAG: tandem-95 repeat protein [Nanoarchaeota archaeon]